MKRAVIYTRVSTDEQANYGFSLRHQLNHINNYCRLNNIDIIKHFEDDHSAKTFDRPEYQKLEQFIKANKKDIDYLIFTKWDRFSRNTEGALSKLRLYKNIGISLIAIDQTVDLNIPENKFMLNFYLTNSEVENEKISIRTKEGSRRARVEGCWTGPAPYGYTNVRVEDKSTLAPNENAPFVVKIFEMLATGLYTTEFIRRKLSRDGFKLKKQAVLNLVKNITYTGKILVKAYLKDEAEIVWGLHPPIISEDLFNRVQDILAPRNRLKGKAKIQHEEFPLRGHLQCRVCGGNLTGSASTSRNKDKHYYYHCQKGCKERFKAVDANSDFERLLRHLDFNNEVADLYKLTIKEIFSERKGHKEAQITKLLDEISDKTKLLETVQDRYYADKIDEDEYRNAKLRYQCFIRDKQAEVEELKNQDSDTLKHFNYCISFLSNIAKYYNESDIQVKSKMIGSIFSEKLTYSENKYRTSDANKFFLLFDNAKVDLGIKESKKASISAGLSTKAPEAGLEPATL